MKGTPAIYNGRVVNKTNFCAFVYGVNGERKLVKSWDQFEACMQSGIWFASIKDAKSAKAPEMQQEEIVDETPKEDKPKPKSKPVAKSSGKKMKEPPQKAQKVVEDETVFEVTEEDGA